MQKTYAHNCLLYEAFNVLQPKDHNSIDYKLWVNIKKAGGLNYKYSSLIWTWFLNDKQSLLDQKKLEEIYSTKFNTFVLDLLDLYNALSKAFLDAGIKTVKLELNRLATYFKFNGDSGLRLLKSANLLKDLMQQLSQKKKLLIGDEQHDDGEFAFNAVDKNNILFFGKEGDVICFCTKDFESTNKFIFLLWHDPNMDTSSHGNGTDDSACKVNSPFCTRMKKHWITYSNDCDQSKSEPNPDYELFWFFLDPGIPNNISKHMTLANDACWDAFQMLNGRGYLLLIGLTDTFNDNNDRFDDLLNGDYEKMKDINGVSHKNEIEKLLNGHISKNIKFIKYEDPDALDPVNELCINRTIYSKEQLPGNTLEITEDIILQALSKAIENVDKYSVFTLRCENAGLTSIDHIDFSRVNKCILDGNKILNVDCLSSAISLRELYIQNNDLTSLNGIPSTVAELYLYGNEKLNDFSLLETFPALLQIGGRNINEQVLNTLPKQSKTHKYSNAKIASTLEIANSPSITNLNFLENIINDNINLLYIYIIAMNSIVECNISFAILNCLRLYFHSCDNILKIYCNPDAYSKYKLVYLTNLPKLNYIDPVLYNVLKQNYFYYSKDPSNCHVINCKLLEQLFDVLTRMADRYLLSNNKNSIAQEMKFDMQANDFLILSNDGSFVLNNISKIDLTLIDDNTLWDVLALNPKIEEATKFVTGLSLDKNSTIYNLLRTILNNFKTKNISFIDAVQLIRKLKNNNLYEWYGSKQLSEYPNSMQALISKQQSQEQKILESMLKALFRKLIII